MKPPIDVLTILLLACTLVGTSQAFSHSSLSGFVKIAASDVFFDNAAMDVISGPRTRCAVLCNGKAQCLSFSFHQMSGHCLLYHRRVMYGELMSAAAGFDHYWRMSDNQQCPTEVGFSIQAGECVLVSNESLPTPVSEAKCRDYGGHLFVAETAGQLAALTQAITTLGFTFEDYRVGARMVSSSPVTWRWITGAKVNDGFWKDGLVEQNAGKACLETPVNQPDRLHGGVCNWADRYVCQIPLGASSP